MVKDLRRLSAVVYYQTVQENIYNWRKNTTFFSSEDYHFNKVNPFLLVILS